MKKRDWRFAISILLLIFLPITAILEFIQAQLELRKFVPHRYFAYITINLAAIHVLLNWKRFLHYFSGSKKSNEKELLLTLLLFLSYKIFFPV